MRISFLGFHPLANLLRKLYYLQTWSEMTLNYWMRVERYPNLREEVGSSIPGFEISSLLVMNLPGGQLPPMPVGLLSQYIYIYNLQTSHTT